MMRSKADLAAIIAIAAMATPFGGRRHDQIFARESPQDEAEALDALQKAQHKRDRKAAKRLASAKGKAP